ncbi:hypothetical protein L0B52_05685 [Suttonella sp. R2A3]|uniref:calcium-binding protein n=1 Tax=Suttonella sp. R2A3 TaxID=2908648 RepID=UPI001F395584|nr:calcium-binding protein [Suttonella sp. R2A3]UJF23839.1 hypothetical protein L0B52_05685 [Suttonella sp. R2A3]
MAMFDYKHYTSNESAALMATSKQLAVYGNISGIMGLPTENFLQGLSDRVLNHGLAANKVNLRLPDGWRELTPTELNMPEDSLDFYGQFPIESPITGFLPSGPQAKILGRYDDHGTLTQISVVFAGTNSPIDILDYFQINENTIAPNMEPLLNKVKELALANGLSGEDVLVTGYSLGGGMTNIMAKHREALADGFFKDADYIGHSSPYIYDDSSVVLNMGYENDVVYRVVGNEASALDAIKAGKPGLVNPNNSFESSFDNIVLFDEAYASPLWNISPFSILNIPFGWYAHIDGVFSDAVTRIADSAFYEFTHADSTVIVSSLTGLSRGTTWVEDKTSPTSNHHNTPAFIIGTQYDDKLKGGDQGDYIDGGKGNDTIKTGTGADRIEGGEGKDTLIFDGRSDDWNVYRLSDDTLFFNSHADNGLKQVSGVEQISFTDDWLSNTRPYQVSNQGLTDQRFKLLRWANKDIAYQERVEGSEGDDMLSGEVVFAQAGNDTLKALDNDSLLHGGKGHDVLIGGAGADQLYGAEGNDVLIAGSGDSLLSGGLGDDYFIFQQDSGTHRITDFNADSAEHDTLLLSQALFSEEIALGDIASQHGDDVLLSYQSLNISVENSRVEDVLNHSAIVVI